jgi:tRNA (cytidine32/uridine32-2'-O)-methyltransferase
VLTLPIHSATLFVLMNPHYPENVGAAARAIKTMGFFRLAIVKPSRLAIPEHEMAHKMAVKAWDVLSAARVYDDLAPVSADADVLAITTSRRGVSGIESPRRFAKIALASADAGGRIAILFGNEKTGLNADLVSAIDHRIRIPMAADQPSINLAQATQIVAYELFVAALDHRLQSGTSSTPT